MPLSIREAEGQRRWSGFVEPEAGVALPCTVIRGMEPGKRLLVTAGVHGAEYSSIEAARRLTRHSWDGLRGELHILPVVSIEAFWKHLAFMSPLDGKNLNRVFPGDAKGSASERRAAWLTEAMTGMDAYIDLHCGDMTETLIPFAVFPDDPRATEMALASGLPYAVKSGAKGHSYAAALSVGVPGLILESGGNGLWTEESVGLLVAGVERIMRRLGMLPAAAGAPEPPAPTLCRMATTAAPAAGYWHPAVALGMPVEIGTRLGTLYELTGAGERAVLAETAGFVLYHSTSLAISAGEALVGVAI
jgi:predicted deacylase